MLELISQVILSLTLYMLILLFVNGFRFNLRYCILFTGLLSCLCSSIIYRIRELKVLKEQVNLINILGYAGLYLLAGSLMRLHYINMYIGLVLIFPAISYIIIKDYYFDVIKKKKTVLLCILNGVLYGIVSGFCLFKGATLLWDVPYVLLNQIPETQGVVVYATRGKSNQFIYQYVDLENGIRVSKYLNTFVIKGDYVRIKYLPHSKIALEVDVLNR